jgi:hypothetical protein
VIVAELFDALMADYQLRGVASHLKHVRVHSAAWRAAGLSDEAVDQYISSNACRRCVCCATRG